MAENREKRIETQEKKEIESEKENRQMDEDKEKREEPQQRKEIKYSEKREKSKVSFYEKESEIERALVRTNKPLPNLSISLLKGFEDLVRDDMPVRLPSIHDIKQQIEKTDQPHSSLDISLFREVHYLFPEEAKEFQNQLGNSKSRGNKGVNTSYLTVTYHHPISGLDGIVVYCKSLDGYDMHLKCVVDVLERQKYFVHLEFLNYFGVNLRTMLGTKTNLFHFVFTL